MPQSQSKAYYRQDLNHKINTVIKFNVNLHLHETQLKVSSTRTLQQDEHTVRVLLINRHIYYFAADHDKSRDSDND